MVRLVVALILAWGAMSASSQAQSKGFSGDSPALESKTGRRIWYLSLAALAAGNALDIHSSWGGQETNPALRTAGGTFGMRSVGIKLGIQAPLIAFQLWHQHRRPSTYSAGAFAASNFALGAVFAGAAVHNYGVSRVQPATPIAAAVVVAAGRGSAR